MTSTHGDVDVGHLGWTQVLGEHDERLWERTDAIHTGHRPGFDVHVLVIGDNSSLIAHALTLDMARAFPRLCLDHIDGPADLPRYNASLGPSDHVALGIITSEVQDIDSALADTESMPILAMTRWMVVTDRDTHSDLTRATTKDLITSIVTVPWTVPLLIGQSYSTMVRHMQGEGRTRDQIISLIGHPPAEAVQGPLLEGLGISERRVVLDLLAGVERVLGHRPRLTVPPGTQLVTQGERVSAVHLVLDGDVSLHRDSARGEVLAHHASSGPLIGLVSLARGESAFFTGVTTSPTTLVRLTTEQLQIVLANNPSIGSTLTALAIRSLTRRLMRAEDLHLQNAMLAEDLEAQKTHLAEALEDLRNTRAQLVERAKFAMLGELSAGIAHELNNPVTALVRAAEHVGEDADRLLKGSPELASARVAMEQALTQAPRSTARDRELVRTILPEVGEDRNLARRLVRLGVETPEEARAVLAGSGRDLESIEAGARLGASLRSVIAASQRVITLTHSLKGYARPDADEKRPLSVAEGIEDVLRLTNHRLRGIDVERDYADVPEIIGHPAKLQQVWTNLLVNAAEALEGEGQIGEGAHIDVIVRSVSVECSGKWIEVIIADNGPGIAPELIDKIFEPHFTTKAGRVRFGLGMGMSIVQSIVSDHSGTLTIDSRPGCTRISVRLPIDLAGESGGLAGGSGGLVGESGGSTGGSGGLVRDFDGSTGGSGGLAGELNLPPPT
ncbi:cyclic nucleotide-binding domain-containing protein [Schaalia sp. ZJ405]|uniref:sensor histidine kinase n=1 Tax=Schaalia sp. ZJ405 TaxID=2709403 RepID=UPI0013EB9419|nr:ATP-binding protein [Schaalia sp. ZJ405]QPK81353.1 cyclic nucleotide-binding domain-containing protein [Schaalia sp. ZJ405]